MNSSLISYHRLLASLREEGELYHSSEGLNKDIFPQLMVVTKNQPVEAILPLLEVGHLLFGENRVQEALKKWPPLKGHYPQTRLHLIGPLQRNKVPDALKLFDTIETLDRVSLIETIAEYREKHPSSSKTNFLIQVNVGNEPQKSGVALDDFQELYEACQNAHLPVRGLMCIPPQQESPTPYFKLLKELTNAYNLPILSMGMSNDYREAIHEGASWVRIGSAIFKDPSTSGEEDKHP